MISPDQIKKSIAVKYNRATAQNPTEFSNTTSDEEGWSLEKDADQARWFLEQPAAAQTTADP